MDENGLFVLETPRGNFKIMAQFATGEEARKSGYNMWFPHENFDVYTRSLDDHGYRNHFAVVKAR
jgi:hypothetical protein